MWTLTLNDNRLKAIHRHRFVKWFYLWIIFHLLLPIQVVNCVSKCQKALDAAAVVTAQVMAENTQLAKELMHKHHRHFQLPIGDDQTAAQYFSPQNLPNILDSGTFDQPDVNQMVVSGSLANANLPSVYSGVTHESAFKSVQKVSSPMISSNNVHSGGSNRSPTLSSNVQSKPPESSLLVSQETRAFRARPNNKNNKQLFNKVSPHHQQQFQLRGLTNDENYVKFDVNNNVDKNQFIVKPKYQMSHKISSSQHTPSSSTNQMPHYFSSQQTIATSASSSFFNNLRPPYILHQGDVYFAYFDCIDQNSLNVEQTSPLVQSAMSAVWATHRFNQLNSSTSSMSIKLGVYYFDVCNYNNLSDQKDFDFRTNSVDDSTNGQSSQTNGISRWIADDKQIENYLKLIEYNSLNNFSSNNRNNGLSVIPVSPKTGVRSYQRNGKQQVHKMKPIIGIVCDVSRMHPQSIAKLNKIDLPVININQLPDYNGWIAEPGVSLGKRIFNVYPAVQQLCKGVFNLVKKLNWTFAVLDFSKFENVTSTNDNQIERKLTPQQSIFVRCLSKLAARDSAFTFRLDSTDGQALENEIIFLSAGKSQNFMNALVAGYLSNKPNRIIATLDNLSAELDTAIIEHHLAGKRFHLPFNRKGRSLEDFTFTNGPYFIQPDWDVTSDFFDFFNIELRNANIQSKHRLMSKLSEQLLLKAFNGSGSSMTFTENELNSIRPVVHYFKDSEDQLNHSNGGELHQKFNKLNHNLTKLLKSRNLFEVNNHPAVVHVIKGVWTLGFTLAKLIKNVCASSGGGSSIDRKRNCMNRVQQVLDSDKQFVRNLTINLNEKVNIRMSNHVNHTLEEERLQFDRNLQLTTVHYTVNRLNNSQLIKVAYYTECCGFRSVQHNQLAANFDLLNTSMQPILFNNAYSIVSSSNHYQINRPTQSTPSFGTRLSTRKTTKVLATPTKQTSTTVTIENNATSTGVFTEHTESGLDVEVTTEQTKSQIGLTSSDLKSTKSNLEDSSTESSLENDSRTMNSNEQTNDELDKTSKTSEETTTNRPSSSTTLATTLSTIEVVRISAEPESNDIFLDKQRSINQTQTTGVSDFLNSRRNNQFNGQFSNQNVVQSNQTKYIKKSFRKPIEETANLSYDPNSRRKGNTNSRPYVKEQVMIRNGKIVLNNTESPNVHSNVKLATIASVISDRHSLNQFRKDNEAEIERRFSIVILFLSIGGSLLTLYVFIFLLVKSCENAFGHHSHQVLAITQLIAILAVYCSSGFYIFQLNTFTINLRNSIHNVALALLFACLLQRALFLRSQRWIGLGGKISMLNQCITLLLIFCVQLALEIQKWSYENAAIHDFTVTDLTVANANANQFLTGQCYLMIISCLLLLVAFSARQHPFTSKEGKHVYFTSLICCPLYLGSVLFLYNYLVTMNSHNQHLQSVASNSTFNLTNAQSLQWSSNTLFLNNTRIKIKNQTVDLFDTTTLDPITNFKLPTTSPMRTSVEYLPKPSNLQVSNFSNDGLIKLNQSNQPTFDFLFRAALNNSSLNVDLLENLREYTDYHHKLTVIKFVDLVQSFVLIVLATVTLFGIFGPIVVSIHRNGVLPNAQNSYTDSLSTAFTLFKTGSNSQQQFVINKNVKQKSFLSAFAFNQRRKENSLETHSQFKQLTNSLQSPVHLQCSSETITGGESTSATSESSFTNTDNISHTDTQSPTTSHHHFHHHHHSNSSKKPKSTHDCIDTDSNDEDGLVNEVKKIDETKNEINLTQPIKPPLPPLPPQSMIIHSKMSPTNKSPPSNIDQSVGCGAHFNFATNPNYHKDYYHKSIKYVINNLVNENKIGSENLGHKNLIANLQTNGHNHQTNLHPALPNLMNESYKNSSKPRLVRTNPLYEENQFRSAYP